MNNLIQWPRAKYWDRAWNPIVGCKPCSPACENCYAAAWAKRFGQSFKPHDSTHKYPPTKGVVFCGNMTDLFGEWVDKEQSIGFISRAMMNIPPTYLWLTKRVSKMTAALNDGWVCEKDFHRGEDIVPEWLTRHFFGFTAENQEWYDKRGSTIIEPGCRFPEWANLWISAEPLLGPIPYILRWRLPCPKWVVVGCESGPRRRPCKVEWVESIVDQCRSVNVPVFVKQLDIGGKCVNDINKFPPHLRIRQVPWAKQ